MSFEKSDLRRRFRTIRSQIAKAERAVAAQSLAERMAETGRLPFDSIFAGYWPIGDEIDPRPLLQVLAERGNRLALPVAIEAGRPLIFREWEWGTPLEPGPHGTSQPSARAIVLRPALVLVPLLAFDRRGYRLGYGGGYYDRTLAGLRASGRVRAVGVGFSVQEIGELPATETDQKLDAVATDREWIEVKG